MARRDRQRSADALEALAAAFIAWTLYPAAQRLIEYLDRTDDETIRADARAAAEALDGMRERIVGFVERPAAADSGELEALRQELDELRESGAAQAAEIAAQTIQINALRAELDAGERTLSQNNEAHAAEANRLIEMERAAVAGIAELEQSLADLSEENHKLRAKSDSYAAALRERAPLPTELALDAADEDADATLTIEGEIEVAREQCDRVIIPDAALREIEALQADEKSADWAREILRGLQALQAYAEEAQHFTGGFWEWCEHSNHAHRWNASPQKLAMSESDTVKNDSRLWRARRFLISTRVEPNGYKHMEAHLKIAEGGGQHIPRLYFHDDAKGRTGNVHVGFIGPHRLVPNTHS